MIDNDGNPGNEELRWGNPFGGGTLQSGYRYDSASRTSFNVNTGVEFALGKFSHFNFPIFLDSTISGAQLGISTDLYIAGNSLISGPFSFSFVHSETPNDCDTLLNTNCANDLVSFSNIITTDTFIIGYDEFTLELLGFRQGGITTSGFSTVEGQTNVAQLMAIFRAPTNVPEPGTVVLLSLGLLAMRLARKHN
jgi:hypothetical protein